MKLLSSGLHLKDNNSHPGGWMSNYAEIPAFVRWAKDKGFDGVNLSHIRNWGTYDEREFYENVSMFDKSELVRRMICGTLYHA